MGQRRTAKRASLRVLAAACAVPVLLVGACRSPGSAVQQTAPGAAVSLVGTATYFERIALPPDAELVVRLIAESPDGRRKIVATRSARTDGAQVPLPFVLEYEPARLDATRRHFVDAVIRGPDGGPMFATRHPQAVPVDAAAPADIALRLTRTAGRPAGRAAAMRDVPRTFVFDCADGVSFTVRTGPGEVAAWWPAELGGGYAVLGITRSASGARYADGDTVFWNRGELATFAVGGRRYVDCRSNPAAVPWADARRRGVALRALGQEPPWVLEIEPGRRFVVTMGYDGRRVELPFVEPDTEAGRIVYDVATDTAALRVVIAERPCTDTMSGELFGMAVELTLDGRVHHGCGRSL